MYTNSTRPSQPTRNTLPTHHPPHITPHQAFVTGWWPSSRVSRSSGEDTEVLTSRRVPRVQRYDPTFQNKRQLSAAQRPRCVAFHFAGLPADAHSIIILRCRVLNQ